VDSSPPLRIETPCAASAGWLALKDVRTFLVAATLFVSGCGISPEDYAPSSLLCSAMEAEVRTSDEAVTYRVVEDPEEAFSVGPVDSCELSRCYDAAPGEFVVVFVDKSQDRTAKGRVLPSLAPCSDSER